MDNDGSLRPSVESVIGPSEASHDLHEEDKSAKAMELPGTVQPTNQLAKPVQPVAPAATDPVVTTPAIAPSAPPPADPIVAAPIAVSPDSPALAEDNDLIEPEWVDKAKAIVERTHNDPYLQNKQINKFKADYLIKRYKKQIKVAEE